MISYSIGFDISNINEITGPIAHTTLAVSIDYMAEPLAWPGLA